MTKKHFIELADALRKTKPSSADDDHVHTPWESTVSDVADFCLNQNPRFDRSRWVDYINGKCGPSGGNIKTDAK